MRVLWIVILLCGLLAVLPAAAGGRDAPAVAGAAATAPAYAPVPPWWRTLAQRVRARAPFLARVRLAPLRARPPLLATLPGRPLSRVRIQAARIYRIATERPNGLRNMCTNLAIRKIQFALGHPRADRTLGYRHYAAIVEAAYAFVPLVSFLDAFTTVQHLDRAEVQDVAELLCT